MKRVPQTIQEYQQAFDEYYQPLCNFAYQFVKDRDEAEDVVQTVFISLWKKRGDLKIKTKLSSYLFMAAKNNALMVLRRRQYESKYAEQVQLSVVSRYEEDVKSDEEQLLLKEKIWRAVQTLPPKCQQIFKLSKVSGLTYKEIAEDLSISVKTVENQMSKALKILRIQLKNIFYIILFVLLFTELLWAQQEGLLQRKVDLSLQKASIGKVLSLLREATNVPIAYSSNQISLQKQIEFKGTEQNLGDYLNQIAEYVPIRIVERKRKVLLVRDRKRKNLPSNPNLTRLSSSNSTSRYTISGYVKDAESGEALIGATVYDAEYRLGASTNTYGFYSLTLPVRAYNLMVSYVGYASNSISVNLRSNVQKNVFLQTNTELEEVVVKASESEQIQELDQMSSNKLYAKKIKELPVLMGEADVIRSVQLLPGVQSVNENANGLYVRGGGSDQNLMLLDGATMYETNHLFGFVSVFDGDAINSVELIKGGFPAQYGGRLSSVLDVRLKEGNEQKHHGRATLGLFSRKLSVEGPTFQDGSSFHISGRGSWTNHSLAEQLIDVGENSYIDYGFYDIYAKLNHRFSPSSRVFLSIYTGRDEFYTEASPHIEVQDQEGAYHEIQPYWETNTKWQNELAVLRWNEILNPRLFANFTFNYSDFQYSFGNTRISNTLPYTREEKGDVGMRGMSNILDWSFKMDFDFYSNAIHHWRGGLGYTNHLFTPGIARFRNRGEHGFEFSEDIGLNEIPADDYYTYLENTIQLRDNWSLNLGMHLAGFKSDNTHYFSPQPRISMRYLTGEFSAFKASFAKMTQFIHQVNTPWVGLPTDLWMPSSSSLKPKHSNQFALGYVHRIPAFFDVSVETYYKSFNNLLTFRHDSNLWMKESLPEWEQELEGGRGRAYGLEVLLERKIGRTTGWVAYTLSKSEQRFENINNNEWFAHQYDRRHDVSIALTQELTPQIKLGMVWVYASGNLATIPFGEDNQELVVGTNNFKTSSEDENFDNSLDLNNYRMPAYHRLDLSVNWYHTLVPSKKIKGSLKVGLYNAYNRNRGNAAYLNQYESGGLEEDVRVLGIDEVSLLPRLPFVTYGVEF